MALPQAPSPHCGGTVRFGAVEVLNLLLGDDSRVEKQSACSASSLPTMPVLLTFSSLALSPTNSLAGLPDIVKEPDNDPRPTRRPGATARSDRRSCCRRCSNPRPTRRPGATGYARVNIAALGEFQSSPDPKAGRNSHTAKIVAEIEKFQSSPDPKAGRNLEALGAYNAGEEFQSSPDPKAGRNKEQRCETIPPRRVPILARPEGRAQPVHRYFPMLGLRFQSSPDPKAGRNPPDRDRPAVEPVVPILARPEGRAQHEGHDTSLRR